MSKTDDNLSKIFDITPMDTKPSLPIKKDDVVYSDDVESDFHFARKNMRDLIEKGNIAVDNILQVASATDHPRAYEVAANLLKQLGDMNKDILELQKKRRDLSPQKMEQATTVNVDKAVFVGSTAELIKQIKGIE